MCTLRYTISGLQKKEYTIKLKKAIWRHRNLKQVWKDTYLDNLFIYCIFIFMSDDYVEESLGFDSLIMNTKHYLKMTNNHLDEWLSCKIEKQK